MIYLASVRSSEIDEIKERFRAGGIPVFIAPDYTIENGGGYGVASNNLAGLIKWYSIKICLDDQIEEAKHLFNDANYKVMAPVDVDKFESTMGNLGANRDFEWRLSDKSLTWIIGLVILGFVLLILRAVFASS